MQPRALLHNKLLNKSATKCSLLLQSRKFWWCLLLTSSTLLHDVIMTSYWRLWDLATKIKILIENLHDSKGYGARKLMKEFPGKGWSKSGLSCIIMSTRDKSIVWMNWNGSSSMSGAVLNSRFLMRLLTSGEENFERVSVLMSTFRVGLQLVNWQCWFCPYLLHSVWLVWLLYV